MRRVTLALILLLSGLSQALAQNPVPFLNQPVVPSAVAPGGPDFTLTVNGTGFVDGATINWNGSPLATTFVSFKQLTATVPAANIAGFETASITVTNPAPAGGTSNVVLLQVAYETPAPITLGAPNSYPSGSASSIITGDFNGDGITDFVGCYAACSVVLGNGDGTFKPPIVSSPINAYFLAVGDFNGDGKLDVVAVDGYSIMSVLLGNGDGTFRSPVYQAGVAADVVAGDFNGDGKLDLAFRGGSAVMLGNGDGTFQTPISSPGAGGGRASVVGDFDGDGFLDVLSAGPAYTGAYLSLGNGDGTFQAAVLLNTNSEPAGVVAADFNGDGKLDVVVPNTLVCESSVPGTCGGTAGGTTISVFLGKGDGTFQPRVDYPVRYPGVMVVGDFNADGHVDLAVLTGSQLAFLLGNGDGTFQPYTQPANSPLNGTENLVAGDFDRDGYLDVAGTYAPINSNSIISVGLQLPGVSIAPKAANFGDQLLGTTKSRDIALTNNTSTPMNITGMSITGVNSADYTMTTTCGTSLPQGSCTITVTFTPGELGPRTASLVITDSGPGGAQTVPLSGTGVNPIITLSASSLDFGSQPLTVPTAKSVTLSVSGAGNLTPTSITASGNFSQTNNCFPSVANGASCTISVTFTPTTAGPLTGEVTITDNAADSPQTILLSGTGVPPVVTLSATSLDFGSVPLTVASTPQTVTLTNTGPGPLSLTGISLPGSNTSFSETNNCPATLPNGGQCLITVVFNTNGPGTSFNVVSIADNAADSPQTINLSGSGIPPTITVSPTSLTFAAQLVNTNSPPQTFTITNHGPGPLTVGGTSNSGPFGAYPNCPAQLAVSADCTVSIVFSPQVNGPANGTIPIYDNAIGNPHAVNVSGTGLGPVASLSPTALNFSNQLLATTSAPQTVTLTNAGGAKMTLSGIFMTGPFAESNNCTATLAAGASCTIQVTFTPGVAGSANGSVSVTSDAPSSANASLAGSGTLFMLSATQPSASVTAGGTATYTLNVSTASGFNQPITLGCIGGPPFSQCAVSPNPVIPGGAGPAAITVSVQTFSSSLAGPRGPLSPPGPWARRVAPLLLLLFALAAVAAIYDRRALPANAVRRYKASISPVGTPALQFPIPESRVPILPRLPISYFLLPLCLLVMIFTASCGGGGNNVVQNRGTPPGNYLLTIAATTPAGAGTTSQTITLSLKVT